MSKIKGNEFYKINKLMGEDPKAALDKMINDGHSRKEIRTFYDEIGFYPNDITIDYIAEKVAK
jgi:hypothetical protein